MTHVLIVNAGFYTDISNMLIEGAKGALREEGASWEIINVPGALEIAPAIRYAMDMHCFSGYVALGCVIRGDTYHFEIVSNESARGITDLMLNHRLAIGNGVLTTENKKQAITRADPQQANKGASAAYAALSLIKLKYDCESAKKK